MASKKNSKEGERKGGWKGIPHRLWVLLAISIPAITFGISASLLAWVSGGGHHFVGIAVSVVLLVVAIGFMKGTIDELRIAEVEDPLPSVSFLSVTSFSVAAILILLCVFAEMSFVLLSWKVAVFLPSGGPASYPNMLGTYAWFFMDMIPFIEPAKTFGMTGPQLQPDGWVAGGPIFAFQAVVVVYLLEVFRRGWLLYQRHSTQQFYQRLGIKAESNDPTSKSGGSEK